jgi:hypothetical protein
MLAEESPVVRTAQLHFNHIRKGYLFLFISPHFSSQGLAISGCILA